MLRKLLATKDKVKVKNEMLRKFWATVGSSFVGLKETDLFAGSFGWDIDCANSLAIRVKSSAGVLPLITRSDGFDQKRNFPGGFVIHHLMLFISLHLQSLACPDDLKYFLSIKTQIFFKNWLKYFWIQRFHFAQYDDFLSALRKTLSLCANH